MKLKKYVNSSRGISAYLAKQLGVSPVMVSQWANGVKQVPAERCIEIEDLTDGKVTCEELRPDLNWSVLRNNPRVNSSDKSSSSLKS